VSGKKNDFDSDALKKNNVATAPTNEGGVAKRFVIPMSMLPRMRYLRRLRGLRQRGRFGMRKRGQVTKPRFVVRDGFVYMKAPDAMGKARNKVAGSPAAAGRFRNGAPDQIFNGPSQHRTTASGVNRDHITPGGYGHGISDLLGNPLLLSNTMDLNKQDSPLMHTSIPSIAFPQQHGGAVVGGA